MHAIVSTAYGSPSQTLKHITDAERPGKPSADQIQINVKASSVNPVDWKISTGKLAMLLKFKHPYIVGADVAGVVTAVGQSVTHLKVGDRVYFDIGADKQGAYAEVVNGPARAVTKIPDKLSFTEAAAIPLAALTSVQALTRYASVQPGSKVLVVGAAGGVGTFGVQVARALGAQTVTGVCSSKNAEFVKQLGATDVIAYDQEEWGKKLSGQQYDVVFDAVGGKSQYDSAVQILKRSGAFVTIAGDKQGDPNAGGKVTVSTALTIVWAFTTRKLKSFFGSPSYHYFMLDAASEKTRHELEQVSKWVQDGKVKPIIQKTYDWESVAEMWEESMKGRVRGKLVIDLSTSGSNEQSTNSGSTASQASSNLSAQQTQHVDTSKVQSTPAAF